MLQVQAHQAKTVFIIGAGPAGLFAARLLADHGHRVVIFNRDIKPGGLAEYGIYPTKEKMRSGLRKQFDSILAMPNIAYFGHVHVGYDLSLITLRSWNPAAIIVAAGAQGTKRLGIPGEDAQGVYAAKDFVYHYNGLPPFSQREYATGRRVVIVGMGNVMVDVARWLLEDDPQRKTEQVLVLARRGPFEAKFSRREFAHIDKHLERHAFERELDRIKDCLAPGEDVMRVADANFPIMGKPYRHLSPNLRFRFLTTPVAIHTGSNGHIRRVTLAENRLVATDKGIIPQPTGETAEIECDALISAIGDVVDPRLGLPVARGGYETLPETTYESLLGIYIIGWARKASEGLVGTTRMEAERGATLAMQYLDRLPPCTALSFQEIAARLPSAVTKRELQLLEQAEANEAEARGLPWFKFRDDASMRSAIAQESHLAAQAAAG